MRLLMTLVVRDEADILATQLEYHRAQGVDFFLVLDHRSVDQTPELLQAYAQRGWLHWFQTDSLSRHQGEWVTTLARKACLEYDADWVINNDADEFWWSDRGSLKAVLSAVPAVYRLAAARRHNFISFQGFVAPFWKSLIYRQQPSVNFLGEPLSGKICHRAESEIVVQHGNHSVFPMQAADFWPEAAFEIFHFPVRTAQQFERKVRNGGSSWVANPLLPAQTGLAKRQLYQQYLRGQLAPVFAEWCLSTAELQARLAAGQLVKDSRFCQFVSQLPA